MLRRKAEITEEGGAAWISPFEATGRTRKSRARCASAAAPYIRRTNSITIGAGPHRVFTTHGAKHASFHSAKIKKLCANIAGSTTENGRMISGTRR